MPLAPVRPAPKTAPKRPEMPPNEPELRLARLDRLLALFVPVPDAWLSGPRSDISGDGGRGMPCLPCYDYHTLANHWRKALKWTDGLDRALAVMLASIMSTRIVGADQLWVKVLGPPSSGKSTLCEAVSVNRRYIMAKSTIRGFHTGYNDGSGKDISLVSRLRGKTLVTKDGDSLLQSPNLGQILSEARDIYDSTSRTDYRNAKGNDYSGLRMTWLLCGTNSLRQLDHSELGERFLDCVIMEGIDDELEDDIIWRVVNRTDRNMNVEVDGKPETQYEPELALAMQLTGGYVSYLRDNAVEILGKINSTEESLRKCAMLGKFVAYMRARPSRKQDEISEREFAARLGSQHTRLAKCLAGVLNRPLVDDVVLRRVKQVSLDTSRGTTLDLVDTLYKGPEQGVQAHSLGTSLGVTPDRINSLLRFLRRIGVVEMNKVKTSVSSNTYYNCYILTARLRKLYEEVLR